MSARADPTAQPVYVYGVVAAGERLSLPTAGVAGAPIGIVEHDGIAALVSDFPDSVRVRRSDLLAHLRSLEDVFEQTTVIPCSFGTVLGSRDEVEEHFLAPRRDELRRLLERLAGRVQMNVKAEYDEEAALRGLVAGDRELARLRERTRRLGAAGYYENIRLGELIAARLDAKRAADAERIERRLAPLAAAAAAEATGELLAYKSSFLVDRDRLAEFDRALDELAAEDPEALRFEVMGPLPPTAFARLGQETEQWA